MKYTNKVALLTTATLLITNLSAQNAVIDCKTTRFEGIGVSLMQNDNAGTGFTIACDTIRNGRFHFDIKLEDREVSSYGVMFVSDRGEFNNRTIWLEPGAKVELTDNGESMDYWDIKSTVEEQRFQEELNAVTKDSQKLRRELESQITRENFETIYAKIDSLHDLDTKLTLDYMLTADINKIWLNTMSTYSSWLIADDSTPEDKAFIRKICSRMSESDKQTETGAIIAKNMSVNSVPEVGDMAIDMDMTLYDSEMNVHRLSDFKGKYMLLDFWSPGCGPCYRAEPELKRLSEYFAGKLEVISLSKSPFKTLAKTPQKITWHSYSDELSGAGIFADYGVTATPTFIMIDPEGRIIDKTIGYRPGGLINMSASHINPYAYDLVDLAMIDRIETSETPEIGVEVPNTPLLDASGKTHKLSELRGKYTIMYLDNSNLSLNYCLSMTQDKIGNEVNVLSVMSGEAHETAATWPVWFDKDGAILKEYGDKKGQIVIISPDGKLSYRMKVYDTSFFMRDIHEALTTECGHKIEKASGVTTIYGPEYQYYSYKRLTLDRIEMSESQTEVTMRFYGKTGGINFSIPENAYLEMPDGTQIKVKESKGFAFGEKTRLECHDYVEFTLVFDAIPQGVDMINFKTGEERGSWAFFYIKLK